MDSLLCQYRYDPHDRLINQTRPDTSANQRFYSKSRLATEIQGAMHYSIFQHGDLLLAQQHCDGGSTSANLLATDIQRSVLKTVEKNQKRHSIAYSPYGHHQAENGLTTLMGFNGERPDPVTGHYLLGNGYRAFSPTLMRFNSPDSLSPFGKGGLNSYAYCLGDPINLGDPTGHSALLSIWRNIARRTLTQKHAMDTISENILISQQYEIGKRVSEEILDEFKRVYSNTEKSLNDLSKPLDFETSAVVDSRLKNMNAPDHLDRLQSIDLLKKQLDTLNKAAQRDKLGNIIGVNKIALYGKKHPPIDETPIIKFLQKAYTKRYNKVMNIRRVGRDGFIY